MGRIEMIVNTRSLRIVDLQVPRIDPPEAARELQPYLDCVLVSSPSSAAPSSLAAANGSSALVRNVTVLCWAMGEWVRVAVQRAKFWAALARLLAGDKGADGEGVSLADSIRELRSRQRKRTRPSRRKDSQGGESSDDDSDDGDDPRRVTRMQLLEHLCRTGMDVEVPSAESGINSHDHGHASSRTGGATFRVEWAIQFDWTGEAKSQIGLVVGVPGKCKCRLSAFLPCLQLLT